MENWLKYKQKEKEFREKAGYDKDAAKKFEEGFKKRSTEKKKKFWRLSDLLNGKKNAEK